MKKLLFAVFAVLSVTCFAQTSVNSRLIKAKALVRTELKNSLHDHSSYKPVGWTSIDSLFSAIEDDPYVCRAMDDLMDKHSKLPGDPSKLDLFIDLSSIENECKVAYEKAAASNMDVGYQMVCLNQWNAVSDFNKSREKAISAIQNFHPRFIGWTLTHKFRAKNALGAYTLNEWEFHFDQEVNSIIAVKRD